MRKIKILLGGKNFRYGAVSVIISITVILFIILLNAMLAFLFKKYPLDIDLTDNKIYEITKETENFLRTLDRDAVIYVMNTESGFTSSAPQEYFIQANEVMRKYTQYTSRIRLEYVDLIRNPGFASRFPYEQLQINDIIISAANEAAASYDAAASYRIIYPANLFNIHTDQYGTFVASSKVEQSLTSALMSAAGGNKFLAAIITGRGEHELPSFTELLILNNYEVVKINLLTGNIPPEASLVILAAPSRDLSSIEMRKIDAFIEGGNNRVLFYLASTTQPALAGLDEFLGEWGVAVDPGVVFETDIRRLISSSPFITLADYSEETYSRNMIQRNMLPLIAHSRPVRALFNEFRFRNVSVLLSFSPTSGVRPINAPGGWTVSPSDITGNVPALVLSTQSRSDDNGNINRSHVLVCGSILALDGNYLANPDIANANYFMDLLGSLTGREEQIIITDKVIGFSELRANYFQILVIAVVFAFLLPLAVLAAGFVVWLRRRHL